MYKNFINIIKSIFYAKNRKDDNEILIEKGILKIGLNSNIKSLRIINYSNSGFGVKITIGSDCMINGTITLFNDNVEILIGDRVFIGPNTALMSNSKIEIRNDVMISWGCTLIDTDTHSLNSDDRKTDVIDWKKGPEYKNWNSVHSYPITIDEKTWIGFNSIIMKGVNLGQSCIVGAGSVVTKSFENFSVIGGNPASFIKKSI